MREIYSKAAGRSCTYKFSWLDDGEIGELDKVWNYLALWSAAQYYKLDAVHKAIWSRILNQPERDFSDLRSAQISETKLEKFNLADY